MPLQLSVLTCNFAHFPTCSSSSDYPSRRQQSVFVDGVHTTAGITSYILSLPETHLDYRTNENPSRVSPNRSTHLPSSNHIFRPRYIVSMICIVLGFVYFSYLAMFIIVQFSLESSKEYFVFDTISVKSVILNMAEVSLYVRIRRLFLVTCVF